MKINVIYNEDCIEGIKKIPNKSIDLVLTDPPYGDIKVDKKIGFITNQKKNFYCG